MQDTHPTTLDQTSDEVNTQLLSVEQTARNGQIWNSRHGSERCRDSLTTRTSQQDTRRAYSLRATSSMREQSKPAQMALNAGIDKCGPGDKRGEVTVPLMSTGPCAQTGMIAIPATTAVTPCTAESAAQIVTSQPCRAHAPMGNTTARVPSVRVWYNQRQLAIKQEGVSGNRRYWHANVLGCCCRRTA